MNFIILIRERPTCLIMKSELLAFNERFINSQITKCENRSKFLVYFTHLRHQFYLYIHYFTIIQCDYKSWACLWRIYMSWYWSLSFPTFSDIFPGSTNLQIYIKMLKYRGCHIIERQSKCGGWRCLILLIGRCEDNRKKISIWKSNNAKVKIAKRLYKPT